MEHIVRSHTNTRNDKRSIKFLSDAAGKADFHPSPFGLSERDGKMIPENPLSCGAKGNRLEREHHSCTMKPEKSVNFSAEFYN